MTRSLPSMMGRWAMLMLAVALLMLSLLLATRSPIPLACSRMEGVLEEEAEEREEEGD